MRLPRTDAFPDGLNWVDTGCEVSPRCLECPLPSCKYETPSSMRGNEVKTRKAHARFAQVREALDRGERAQEIAARMGISIRTIRRASAASH